jgi:hypothetical protein
MLDFLNPFKIIAKYTFCIGFSGGATWMGSKTDTRAGEESGYRQTAEEQELNKLLLQQYKKQVEELSPQTTEMNKNAISLINQLFTSGAPSTGAWSMLGGISEDQTSAMSQKAVADVLPSFQNLGLADSGVALSAAARTAGDIRNQNAQFNVQNALNLLNTILGGQASTTAAIASETAGIGSQLSENLAGLRSFSSYQTGKVRSKGAQGNSQIAMQFGQGSVG